MNLKELRNDVGSRINQYDDATESFVSGFVTTGEVNRWLNQSFEDVYKWYALANRGRFSSTAFTDTVASQAVYPLGGDAKDLLAIETVYILRTPTDTDYKRVYPLDTNEFILEGSEKVPKSAPRFIERQIFNTDTNHYELAIEFPEDCIPMETITDGIKIKYIERPPLMVEDEDEPEKLPRELHKLLVLGASVPALEKMGEFEAASYLENKLNGAIKSFYIQEQSTISKGVKIVKPSRRDINKFYFRNS